MGAPLCSNARFHVKPDRGQWRNGLWGTPGSAERTRGAFREGSRPTAWNGDWPNFNAMARNTTERNSESAAQSFAIRNALAETTDTYSIL